jgi:TatD DNase family protein
MLADTHAHLYASEFADDRMEMMHRALESGVGYFFLPNIDRDSITGMHELVSAFPGKVFPMMGLHPCYVKDDYRDVLEKMGELLATGKYVGVGETGLDYYWDVTYKDAQQVSLQQHIIWAKQYQLPIILHTREAFADTWKLIREGYDDRLCGIFHCFSGTLEEANQVMEMDGFYVGIGGVVTFKNSGLDKVVEQLPLDRMVLETDSPYLAPVPHRGKRNESSYLRLVAEKVAMIKGVHIEEVEEVTTRNALQLFGIGK